MSATVPGAIPNRRKLRSEALRFAGLCLSVSTLMAAFKIAVGLLSGSHALLASALYSINDLLSSIAVAVSLRVGHRKPTFDHPYGYGKAEFIAAGMVSMVIAIGVFFMFFFSVVDVLRGVPGPPHFLAVSLAALSMVVSWVLSRRGHHLAVDLQSPILSTTADHHHADAEGSLLAIVGIGGAVLGFHTLDRVIAIFETLHLIALSGRLLARSLRGLMDSAISDDDKESVRDACVGIDGVERVTHIWSRQAGSSTWVDVAVTVSDEFNVEQAHGVCRQVESAVRNVLGAMVVAQVRFQGTNYAYDVPGPGGAQ